MKYQRGKISNASTKGGDRHGNSNFAQLSPCQEMVQVWREYIVVFMSFGSGLIFSKSVENLEKTNLIPVSKPSPITSWIEKCIPSKCLILISLYSIMQPLHTNLLINEK